MKINNCRINTNKINNIKANHSSKFYIPAFGKKGLDTFDAKNKCNIESNKNNKPSILNVFLKNYYIHNNPQMILDMYINEEFITKAVENNPKIKSIMATQGLDPIIYMENVQGKNQHHFLTTYEKAKELAKINKLHKADETKLLEAALLHDIGKALIPTKILHKPAKLTPDERAVVDLHAELGYEIIKNSNINKDVKTAIKLHHTSYDAEEKRHNKIAQLLSVCDVYSALKEQRSYKDEMPDDIAKAIMVEDCRLNQQYVQDAFLTV